MTTPPKPESDEARQQVLDLLKDPQFLHRVCELIGRLGVVGEQCNRLILFLAMLTSRFRNPISVVMKAPCSAGKSNLVSRVLEVLPSEVVQSLSSLSERALEHGERDLSVKVLYIAELEGAKRAQFSLRLLQSEREIAHETTVMQGSERTTRTIRRKGSPVVVTTTTKNELCPDDEDRYLSLRVDISGEQTRAIARAQLHPAARPSKAELQTVQFAVRALLKTTVRFEDPPSWLDTVSDHLPTSVSTRRDWPRFLSLLRAIVLTRCYRPEVVRHGILRVELSDYAIAFRLLNDAFSRPRVTVGVSTAKVAGAVAKLYRDFGEAVSVAQICAQLKWNLKTVYKHVKQAEEAGVLVSDNVPRPKNEKRFIPTDGECDDFLLSPKNCFGTIPSLGRANLSTPSQVRPRRLLSNSKRGSRGNPKGPFRHCNRKGDPPHANSPPREAAEDERTSGFKQATERRRRRRLPRSCNRHRLPHDFRGTVAGHSDEQTMRPIPIAGSRRLAGQENSPWTLTLHS